MDKLELIDNQELLKDISNELDEHKKSISSSNNEKPKNNADSWILKFSNFMWINENITYEYINIIKKFGANSDVLDENLKKELWFEMIEWKITNNMWCFLFYVKKFCKNNSEKILPLAYDMMQGSEKVIISFVENGSFKKFLWFFETYWDSIYEYLKFCSPFEKSYIKSWISNIYGRNFWETLNDMKNRYKKTAWNTTNNGKENNTNVEDIIKTRQNWLGNTSFLVQFIENFVEESESINLFSFLKKYPQKLNNLWWKEVKTIDLSTNFGINFAFRGIIEMIKSRPDIDFPHLKKNASKLDMEKWKQQREKIIKEYENMLRDYIAKDKPNNPEEKGKTFDKIFFTSSHENTLSGSDDDVMPSKDWAQQFSWNNVSDYSAGKLGNNNLMENRKMISDIEKYVQEHPNEKILVCVNHHGKTDWSSGNWWTKEDWLRLANISPNVKIWSIRCYFWSAFDNKNIYNQKASLSWFSSNTITFTSVTEIINEAWKKNLWFHEMEIYTRLTYPVSITPLTENMEYKNWNTWKTETSKIWLAQNDVWQNNNSNSYT